MNRAALLAGLAGTVLGLAVGGVGATVLADGQESLTPAEQRSTTEVAVKKTTLQVVEEVAGELASSVTRSVTTSASGTITVAATVGATVDRGGVIARIDDNPVVLLFGAQPAWREIGVGASAGADIRQLEENLVTLGFDPAGMEVDTNYDSDTEEAITAWEDALGIAEPDGQVPIGEIVFGDAALQITESTAAGTRVSPGESLGAGRPVTNDDLKVTFTVTEEADRYAVGRKVQVSDATETVAATITAFERVASGGAGAIGGAGQGSSSASFTVTAVPDSTGTTNLQPGPVTVEIPTEVAENVLAVPSRALVAVLEGGQAVQLADSGRLVPVEVGVFSDGWVEVSGPAVEDGSLAEGVNVVVPS